MMYSNSTGKALDLDIALSHVDGDRPLLAELAAMFLQDYPRLQGEARDSIRKGDHASLERVAHTLKGRLAFFGIQKARERVAKLEMMGRMNDLSQAMQALAEVETEMEGILLEFESLSRELGA